MNVSDAAHQTVKSYPGGAEALAPRMGMSGALLRGKVNPNSDRNHLTLQEADELMGLTGDYRILHALNAAHGFVATPAEAEEGADLLTSSLAAQGGFGELALTLQQALADGVITSNELKQFEAIGASVQALVLRLVSSARAHHEASRPRQLRAA
ncbi:phage regulatory CII family protein [Lysobacter antibioticus]|uniref:phage regulatory CII family protein n=1 Tax=Lysobacter antibioticus TaxID=84531 RepID=UPI0007E8C75A|nr:phage regulatory CII family protein [Lysobacter antibioticus]